ncbi:hypothetical protein Ndes2526B_g07043 [Nannochloris sp. 'desiccata']|nr:hypothetical protein KSW81_004890 [Chlorella desiccata (nom. nud.)]KAH7618132.1 hypothetical protein NADE_000333 [Chlorella desiccata (nom. nud.)]
MCRVTMGEKLVATPSYGSLLHFDLEDDASDERQNEWQRANLLAQLSILKVQVSSCLVSESLYHTKLRHDVRRMTRGLVLEDGVIDPVVLATKLSGVGYRVNIRSALGGQAGSAECFYNLRNEFLITSGDEEEDGHYIIEANFRGHFSIPQPTDRYAGLLEMVPEEVVLSPTMLSRLVNLLCSEMSLAFQERGLSLPPWRQGKSLLSKWLPSKSKDFDMSSPSGSPRAAGVYAAGSSPQYSGELNISGLSSGILTPSMLLGDDSPRAVLRGAAACLASGGGSAATPLAVRPNTKQRSLLTSDLIASGSVTPKASTAEKQEAVSARTGREGASTKPPALRGNLGWATPPIRRVKMAGVPASAVRTK